MSQSLSDSHVLELFLERAHQLLDRRLIRDRALEAEFNIHFELVGGSMQLSAERMDEEDLRSFMLALRLFTLQKEPTQLGKVFNLLHRLLPSGEWQEAAKKIRSDWNQSQRQNLVALQLPGQRTYEAEDLFRIMVNGYYFHSDEDARAELDQFGEAGRWLAKRGMLTIAISGAIAVAQTRILILKARDADVLPA